MADSADNTPVRGFLNEMMVNAAKPLNVEAWITRFRAAGGLVGISGEGPAARVRLTLDPLAEAQWQLGQALAREPYAVVKVQEALAAMAAFDEVEMRLSMLRSISGDLLERGVAPDVVREALAGEKA